MRRPGNNSILAIEMNVVATSASIAIVISFINKIEKMLTNDKTAIPRIKRQNT